MPPEYSDAPFQEQTPGRYGLINEYLFTKTQFSSDIEVTRPLEVGKHMSVAQPLWRKEWGISAGEN